MTSLANFKQEFVAKINDRTHVGLGESSELPIVLPDSILRVRVDRSDFFHSNIEVKACGCAT